MFFVFSFLFLPVFLCCFFYCVSVLLSSVYLVYVFSGCLSFVCVCLLVFRLHFYCLSYVWLLVLALFVCLSDFCHPHVRFLPACLFVCLFVVFDGSWCVCWFFDFVIFLVFIFVYIGVLV